jgi:soluble lytic murein transglycosylase-like protein
MRLLAVGAMLCFAAALPLRAQSLCAYRNDSGSIVYTNTPLTDGTCGSAARPAQLRAAATVTVARYDPLVRSWAGKYGVSPKLVHAVIATESAYNTGAVSRAGARGLMQLMPATAKLYGATDLHDPAENIRAGVAHLRDLLDSFGGDVRLALAAYNAGSEAVRKYSGVPPYDETRRYVVSVLSKYGGRAAALVAPAAIARDAYRVEMKVNARGLVSLEN